MPYPLLNRRSFFNYIGSLFVTKYLFSKLNIFKEKPSRPNVIFILADDLGWADLSCYGRMDYETPNLDWLAKHGTRFTNAYAASCVCTPTRCAFITGRYPSRTPVGLEEPLNWHKNIGDAVGLDPAMPTIASLLKENNYYTILIGKWHLGYLPKHSPIKSGYEDFFGIMSGGVDYFTHKDALGEPDLFEDEVPVEKNGYITDLITNRAIEFINGNHDKPFFMNLNYTAPHWPWEGPNDVEKSKQIKNFLTDGGSAQAYSEMVRSMDAGIGKVIQALKNNKLLNNTLIIFTSDNGGERFSHNWPFSGQKWDLLEGGLRVPAIVYWKGIVPEGKITDQAAITMDWTATILAAAQTQADSRYPLDGENLMPVITGERNIYDRSFFWRMRDQEAVRFGKWKYYKKQEKLKDCTQEHEHLFDLSFDEREQSDFKDEQPNTLHQLKEAYHKWNAGMLPYD
ncbi:MAG: sulfatase-like hydrolase/transferase [Saprospiraceae bacterium]|nr:sulfatase-like hydrolase/transferase [Saprospiraceae bacterium]